jgi:type II secretory pathway pseudopilin PulG
MKKKKRALTLLEIMIVIFLITLITGTIGFSFRGTLDKGRAFRTEQAKEQLRDLLLMCLAEGKADVDALAKNPVKYLKETNLAKDPKKLVKDGWNQPFEITAINKSDFKIISKALDEYRIKTKAKVDDSDEES